MYPEDFINETCLWQDSVLKFMHGYQLFISNLNSWTISYYKKKMLHEVLYKNHHIKICMKKIIAWGFSSILFLMHISIFARIFLLKLLCNLLKKVRSIGFLPYGLCRISIFLFGLKYPYSLVWMTLEPKCMNPFFPPPPLFYSSLLLLQKYF